MMADYTEKLIQMALEEDIGSGDITTDPIVAPECSGTGQIVAKETLVIAGLDIGRRVFASLDPDIRCETAYADGDTVEKGSIAVRLEGKLQALLKGERTALNFLQRLSGIATHVRSFVSLLGDRPVRLVDTRKTAPGWRVLEKYAVRVGGGANHRMGLYDGVLIKDNHIAAARGIAQAVEKVRKNISHLMKIEVEVTNMEEVAEAVAAGADVIMLDNMDIPRIRAAVAFIAGRALVEVSGNVSKETLVSLADTGVDLISCGALTHSARSVDLSMRIKTLN
ncbi:MAG: carboxylating nicotinate-nucleotide diphosphorylase [Desulfobacterales bacterium]